MATWLVGFWPIERQDMVAGSVWESRGLAPGGLQQRQLLPEQGPSLTHVLGEHRGLTCC